ncbi:MAG: MoxR family ATPase [Okeania sp. SIO2C9]|uniref:AAA family ATPase n=1 Tax=Okeania sp. SIO2C9 TaxID=2607791 RepID=UPI0013C0EBAD|nr:MoxR family ATPase [Okeania sp. SIO2C9]NEQ72137.1 MoxR family ATPase [Okeania sp. SIO2C9]
MVKNQPQNNVTENQKNWLFFYGDGKSHDDVNIADLPDPPPWRKFKEIKQLESEQTAKSPELIELEKQWQTIQDLANSEANKRGREKGQKFRIYSPETEEDDCQEPLVNVVDAVNAAIYLRRPLLVTGNPGSGKTSLAYAIAYELKLGPVLNWAITARSTLQDGLYRYDAIARLQDSQLHKNQLQDIGQYVTLGPVGTAFLPSLYPRVLLIDEIDKSDINLPNDLLHLFEDGKYEIPELVRWADKSHTMDNNQQKSVKVRTEDIGIKASIIRGRVDCSSFPIVIMTSNGERDFPPAFVRRCLRIRMPDPDTTALKTIINAHFQDEEQSENLKKTTEELIEAFLEKEEQERANDQLLNAIYIRNNLSPEAFTDDLQALLLKGLSTTDEI